MEPITRSRRNGADKVPYVKLPGGDYRIPLSGLLSSLSGTYRLTEDFDTAKIPCYTADRHDDPVVHTALLANAT